MTAACDGPARGDWDEEFAAICQAQRGRLVRWLTALFGARDAEDIAQEALARLYVRPGLLGGADPWPWLAVVARNVGRDLARHHAFSTPVDGADLERLSDAAAAHDTVVAREDAERLQRALRRISPRDRALIELRDVADVPVAEIAERLRMNDNAVRQQLFRARKRLANAYLALGGDRRPGLVALLGLKVREFARRHGHLLHAYGPSAPGVLAVAAPVGAGVAGAVLFGASPAAAGEAGVRPLALAAAPAPAGDAEPRHGAAGPAAAGRAALARLAPQAPGPRPHAVYRQEVGPVRATATFHQSPLDTREGPKESIVIDVYVPVIGYRDRVEHHPYREGSGEGMACRAIGGCRRHIPDPAEERTP